MAHHFSQRLSCVWSKNASVAARLAAPVDAGYSRSVQSSLTILWTELSDRQADVLGGIAKETRATLLRVELGAMAPHAHAALALGALIVVVRTPREASRALGMGADEVAHAEDLSRSALLATIERASARAAARLSREVHRAAQDDLEPVFSELVRALEHQLSGRLGKASLGLEVLASSLPALFDLGDDLVASASGQAPSDDVQRLAARRLALPRSPELRQALAQVRESMGSAETTSYALRSLAGGGGALPEPIAPLLTQIVELLRPGLPPGTEVRVAVEGRCAAHVPPLTVALIVASLVALACESLRAAGVARATIPMQVSERGGAVLLEVQDPTGGQDEDFRPMLFEAYFATSPTKRTRLASLREVETDPSGTTVRVFLPATDDELVLEGSDARHGLIPGASGGLRLVRRPQR